MAAVGALGFSSLAGDQSREYYLVGDNMLSEACVPMFPPLLLYAIPWIVTLTYFQQKYCPRLLCLKTITWGPFEYEIPVWVL